MPKIHGDLEYQASTRAVLSGTGTALLPGITFSGDLNTGIYTPGADQLGFATAGLERLVINDEGALVITDVPVTPSTTTNKLYSDGGTLYWDGTAVGGGIPWPLLAPDGTTGAPSYSFADDTGTGMYSSAANAIAFTSNSSTQLIIDSDEVKTFVPIHATAGTAGAPGLSFNGDIDTGLYSAGTNEIGFSAGSNNVVTIGTTGLSMANGATIFADEIANAPSYSFVNDPDTGMSAHALGNRLEFFSGGTNTLEIRATDIRPFVQTNNIDGTAGAPSYSFLSNQTTGMFKEGAPAAAPIAFSVNSQESLNIESDGTLNVAAVTDYETLVTLDDDIPNKKYVDDSIVTAGTAIQLTEYTATAGQTVFSGADNNAVTLSYEVGLLYVYKNGVLLEDTDDYVATTGSTIVLNTGATVDDVIQATAFSVFTGTGASANDFTYTATASQTTFTGSDDNGDTLTYNAGDLLVYLNGALLIDGTDYTATDETSVVLTVAATAGNIIQVYEWGSFLIGESSDILNQYVYTATASQTTFTGSDDNANTLAYSSGDQKVYLNGALLEQGTDYTASDGVSITLTSPAALNDLLQITAFGTFNVANHYTKGEVDNKYNKFSIQFLLAAGDNDTYTLQQSAQFGFTIDKAFYQTSAGTITGNVQIDAVSVTGMSALSFTSTEDNSLATDNRVVDEGDKVTLVTTSTSGATMVSIILHCTRT